MEKFLYYPYDKLLIMAKKEKRKKKNQLISISFSFLLFAIFIFFNSPKSTITGYTFIGNVVDKSQMIIYNDSGAMLLMVSFAILLIIGGSILIPKYIKNVGMILNAIALIIFLITIIDLFSYKMINLRLIGNFIIATFLLVYGIFILRKKISLN